MNLIKRTVILSGAKAEGYVTVIRVGDDVGAKIVGENFEKGMYVGLKVGNKTFFTELDGKKTELSLSDVDFRQSDGVGCTVLSGEIAVAKGGTAVRAKDVSDYFKKLLSEESEKTLPKNVADNQILTDNLADEIVAKDINPDTPVQAVIAENAEIKDTENDIKEPQSSASQDILDKLGSRDGAEFYNGVKNKIDELYVVHPRDEILSEYLPNSDWIRVKYDHDDYYVVGKLYEEGRTVLLGYGVPGKKEITPPKIAAEIASWLSVPDLDNGYNGYWLIFQDAATGKVVPAN